MGCSNRFEDSDEVKELLAAAKIAFENKLVAFTGLAQSGKDTLASFLINKHGFTKIALAEPMWQVMRTLNPIIDITRQDGIIRYNDAIERVGYESAKSTYPEIRRLLQMLGTEVGREQFGQDFWLDLAMEKATNHRRVVITDMRFENEARRVKSKGGLVIKVVRPGLAKVNTHISEKGFDDELVDYTIINNGTLEDLEQSLYSVLRKVEWMP